jgi:hypothetical protein
MAPPKGTQTAARTVDADIRRMREQGISVREIARRTGLGKSFVHDLTRGKRRLSPERATAVADRLARVVGEMRVIVDGEVRMVEPLHKRDFSKVGKFWNVLERARRTGDYSMIKTHLTKSQRTIRTTQGMFTLETNPAALRELDDAGVLTPDEILIGESA